MNEVAGGHNAKCVDYTGRAGYYGPTNFTLQFLEVSPEVKERDVI